jgi:ribosomal protein S18 acetylase RimI-like enzyme
MNTIEVLPLQITRIPEILEVLTRAYTANPAHRAIFGKDNFVSNGLYFQLLLKNIKSDLFIAESAGAIVGVIGIGIHPLPVSPKAGPLPFTAESLSATASVITRLQERQLIWDKTELTERHYHFGPVAVLPEYQYKGVGSRMVEHCCNILDRENELGYLETESLENCNFYSRFGFQVIYETILFEIPAFFMKRFPQHG